MVLHQLRWIIGDSAFFEGMRGYLDDPALRYRFALTGNYRQHMETASGKDLTEYFDNWIYKQGFPSYTITYSQDTPDNVSVMISQTQSDASVSFFRLPVPLQFFGNNQDTIIVFDNTSSGQVFHCNPGFKIDSVHFDPYNWLISANNKVAMGVNDLPAGKNLIIQPNPANGQLTVVHNLGVFNAVNVIDLSGQAVPAGIEENGPERLILNVSRLIPGTYILTLQKDNMLVHRKFIVSR